jgi:hypothetical protein
MDLQRLAPIADAVLAAVLAHLSPAWVLAAILAAINVCAFRVAMAHEGRSLFYFLPFGLCGFAAGNLLAGLITSPLPMLGDLHVIEASLGAWAALMLANTRPLAS